MKGSERAPRKVGLVTLAPFAFIFTRPDKEVMRALATQMHKIGKRRGGGGGGGEYAWACAKVLIDS